MSKHEKIYDEFVNDKLNQSNISIMEIERVNNFWNGEHNYTARKLSEQCDNITCHAIMNVLAYQFFIGFMKGNYAGYKEGLAEIRL